MPLFNNEGKDTGEHGVFFRVPIINCGKTTAKNVEVVLTHILGFSDGYFRPRTSFVPTELAWAHSTERDSPKRCDMIVPNAEKLCGLAMALCIMPDDFVGTVCESPGAPKVRVALSVFPSPSNDSNVLMPGEYVLLLTAVAENAQPVRKILRVTINNLWSEDEAEMLRAGIMIREASREDLDLIAMESAPTVNLTEKLRRFFFGKIGSG